MDDNVNLHSFTTFTTKFSGTIIQATPQLLSDTFEVSIEFVWNTPDIAKGNAAFLQVKYFLEEVLHHSILTHKSAPINLFDINNKKVVFPFVPTSDIIAMCLHAKCNAIANGVIDVISVSIGSKFDNPSMTYTYGDDEYSALPSLKDWVGTEKYYYDQPWWHRNSPETEDYEVDENTDLTQPPKYDNVLEEINQIVMGELKLKDSGGEVIDISNGWKPKIVKD